MYLSIGWLLISWWPHDNVYSHNGEDMQGLLYIEYGFHVTLMAAGLILAYSFLRYSEPAKPARQRRRHACGKSATTARDRSGEGRGAKAWPSLHSMVAPQYGGDKVIHRSFR